VWPQAACDANVGGARHPAIPDSVTNNPVTNGISFEEITTMRTIASLLAAGLFACSMSGIAADERSSDSATTHGNVVRDGTANGEFGNECSWGLANGKHVKTNCSVNMTGENGKTYCFSNDKAMAAYMKDPSVNLGKASKTYGRG
jgi:hypothetical protein